MQPDIDEQPHRIAGERGARGADSPREPYVPPRLVEMGSFKALTKGRGGRTHSDNGAPTYYD
jgi:hypothetical protein